MSTTTVATSFAPVVTMPQASTAATNAASPPPSRAPPPMPAHRNQQSSSLFDLPQYTKQAKVTLSYEEEVAKQV
jgi:hypothetical protein